jgi:hypothetical protein
MNKWVPKWSKPKFSFQIQSMFLSEYTQDDFQAIPKPAPLAAPHWDSLGDGTAGWLVISALKK